jgi:hypothetical protein
MNRSKIADLSEILSSIAILITLIYLTVEISQNTEALYAQSRQQILTSAQTELFDLAHNPEIVKNIIKTEPLTEDENIKLTVTFTAWMRVREFSWLQYQSGIIDEAQWSTELAVITVILGAPRTRLWWNIIGKPSVGIPFAEFIDELIRDQPSSNDHWILNTNWSAQ